MACKGCGETIPADAAFCPTCGTAIDTGSVEPYSLEQAEQEVHSLLAEANLLRVRGDWHKAILRCTDALRLLPENASAHSLLGDICRDSGRPREGMEWYKLALAIEPTRRTDREKLDALIDQVYTSPEKEAADDAEQAKPQAQADEKEFCFGLRTGLIALIALLFGCAALLAVLVTYLAPQSPSPAINLPPKKPAVNFTPTRPIRTRALPGISRNQKPPEENPSAETTPQTAEENTNSAAGDIAARERKLYDALAASVTDIEQDAALLGANIDPLSEKLELQLSFAGEQLQEEDPEDLRGRILKLSFHLGREASLHDANLKLISLRFDAEISSEDAIQREPVFIGEASAKRLRADTISPDQAEQVFNNCWWHETLAKPHPDNPGQ